jgi:hypothetical protein
MMKRFFAPFSVVFIMILTAPLLYASQSTITEADGNACQGDERSRRQTEQAALADAKRNAAEAAITYIKSESRVEDFALEKDVIAAYTDAAVKILEIRDKAWHRDPAAGDCYRVRIRAEVVPHAKAPAESGGAPAAAAPGGPLQVLIWTDKQRYREGEKIRIRLQGNRPFYARVLYRDASGGLLQLLPNPYRADNYFQGGVAYELPAEGDRFDLAVSPPFGAEDILVYASTSPLGTIDLAAAGGVYQVETRPADVATRTRGVRIEARPDAGQPVAAGFVEGKVTIRTGR